MTLRTIHSRRKAHQSHRLRRIPRDPLPPTHEAHFSHSSVKLPPFKWELSQFEYFGAIS